MLQGGRMSDVQAPSVPRWDHPAMCSLVLQVGHQLPRPGRDDARARRGSRPVHDHAIPYIGMRVSWRSGCAGIKAIEPPPGAWMRRM